MSIHQNHTEAKMYLVRKLQFQIIWVFLITWKLKLITWKLKIDYMKSQIEVLHPWDKYHFPKQSNFLLHSTLESLIFLLTYLRKQANFHPLLDASHILYYWHSEKNLLRKSPWSFPTHSLRNHKLHTKMKWKLMQGTIINYLATKRTYYIIDPQTETSYWTIIQNRKKQL